MTAIDSSPMAAPAPDGVAAPSAASVAGKVEPNFIVIGAMKSATTSLCELLRKHPAIFTDPAKEIHYFSRDHVYANGWDWYLQRFEGYDGEPAIGEGSTSYTQHYDYPRTAQRIAKHLPDAKLIYIVRDPIRRIESHWIHLLSYGHAIYPFWRDVRHNNRSYIDSSQYWSQLQRYRDYFPDDRILVLFMEDLAREPKTVLRQCHDFLGVEPDIYPDDMERKRNTAAAKKVDGRLLAWMSHSAGMWRLWQMTPRPIKAGLTRLLRVKGDFKPQWRDDIRQWAEDQLAHDVEMILKYAGKPGDFWAKKK